MGRAVRPSSNRRSRRSPNVGVNAASSIRQLERRFAKFRRDHPSQTRVPDSLRAAVLAAVREGMTPAQLRRFCGLSPNQLEYWQKNELKRQTPVELAVQEPQIFSVVEDEPRPTAKPAEPAREQQLKLCLNGWSICIHRVDR
jgi:hypothetical protein